MSGKDDIVLTLRFGYRHFQTDGKLQNTLETLEQTGGKRVCLAMVDPVLDGSIPNRSSMIDRFARVKTVINKFRRRGISSDLILPGLAGFSPADLVYKRYVRFLYGCAAEIATHRIWVDDACTYTGGSRRFHRRSLLAWFGGIGRVVHNRNQRIRVGLIAARPQDYISFRVDSAEIAESLAGIHRPLLAQFQPFTRDYHRTEVLEVTQTLAITKAQSCLQNRGRTSAKADLEIIGAVDHSTASPFHKSAEADQMQMNLNVLFGMREILVNCFDEQGTAAGGENLYLRMQENRSRLLNKSAKLLSRDSEQTGIRIIIPDHSIDNLRRGGNDVSQIYEKDCWPAFLWRMGLPATIIRANSIKPISRDSAKAGAGDSGCLYVLTGRTPRCLSRRQFNYIFENGVLLDAEAAETIQEMGLPGLIGVKVGGSIKGVQTEILSDQAFAAPHYGHNTLLSGYVEPGDFRRLSPFHPNARKITTLQRKNQPPNINGMIAFDNTEHNHRCVILPYSLNQDGAAALLNPARQRHFRDVFAWLQRGRLDCFVEDTPDLVPFCIHVPGRRRMVLALLNVGFDWAIDARIRLGRLGFTVKRVRELNEDGKLVSYSHLQVHSCRDYNYIQLTSDTAVPPMQMTVLVLDG